MSKYKPYKVFTKKEKLKFNEELLKLHKRTVTTYLIQKDLSFSKRKKFFILYDMEINQTNIQAYFFLPVSILIKVIVLAQLKTINKYLVNHGKNIRKGLHKPKKRNIPSNTGERQIPIQRKIGSIIPKPKYPNSRYRPHY